MSTKLKKEITGDDGCGRPAIFSSPAAGVASSSSAATGGASPLSRVAAGCFPAHARKKLLLLSIDRAPLPGSIGSSWRRLASYPA
jgi:hypothetical protein